jgi:transposase
LKPSTRRTIHGTAYHHRHRSGGDVFQLHGVDARGGAILKRKLRRGQVLEVFARRDPCLIGLEACAFGGRAVPRTARRSTSPHFWARELTALGHEVRIMPPSYVKPYVKRGKTDGETGPWPQMRPRKPVERCRGDLR